MRHTFAYRGETQAARCADFDYLAATGPNLERERVMYVGVRKGGYLTSLTPAGEKGNREQYERAASGRDVAT